MFVSIECFVLLLYARMWLTGILSVWKGPTTCSLNNKMAWSVGCTRTLVTYIRWLYWILWFVKFECGRGFLLFNLFRSANEHRLPTLPTVPELLVMRDGSQHLKFNRSHPQQFHVWVIPAQINSMRDEITDFLEIWQVWSLSTLRFIGRFSFF